MCVSQRLQADLKGTFGQSISLAHLALQLVKESQIVKRLCCLRMILAKTLFADLQCALEQGLGLFILALFLAEKLPQHVVGKFEEQALLSFTFFDANIPFTDYTSGRIFHHPDHCGNTSCAGYFQH